MSSTASRGVLIKNKKGTHITKYALRPPSMQTATNAILNTSIIVNKVVENNRNTVKSKDNGKTNQMATPWHGPQLQKAQET